MSKSKICAFCLWPAIRFAFLPGLLLILVCAFPMTSYAEQFQVIEVYNGDTIKVKAAEGGAFNVRLAGIDAPELCPEKPELAQPLSSEAKAYLENLVFHKWVTIRGYGQKEYGLMWAEVFLRNKNVNLEMLRAGYAETYSGKSPGTLRLAPYYEAEKAARSAGEGIWALGKQYESPMTWRKRQKARCAFSIILYGLLHQMKNSH